MRALRPRKVGISCLGACVVLLVGAGSAAADTFTSRGEHTYVVPAGVHRIHIDLIGGAGGDGARGAPGGHGGTALGDLDVTPGETLFVEVGAPGGAGSGTTGGAGGVNGGGAGGGVAASPNPGGGGGGGGALTSAPRAPPAPAVLTHA
jgi:hypothetical protein